MDLLARLHLLVALVCALTGTVAGLALAGVTLTALVTARTRSARTRPTSP